MKYVSIDIETTGLLHETHKIVEIACVVDVIPSPQVIAIESLPTFSTLIHPEEDWMWSPYAANLHAKSGLLSLAISNGLTKKDAFSNFREFLMQQFGSDSIVVAGKNFGAFDHQFLSFEKAYGHLDCQISHRFLDPAMFNIDWLSDTRPPNLSECLKRCKLPDSVSHRALDDARQVVALIRDQAHRQMASMGVIQGLPTSLESYLPDHLG